ncbi:MAG: LacI family transcriptional regulator [Alicyclobacillus sp.]|nr:LacI family transcriptional regulator [Alicyclobacillus sp.]
MTTIQEVAQRAGVSTATVSRVLNNSGLVSEDTRRRVLSVVEELNYRPNSAGRSLRINRTHLVMVVLPDITNPFFSKIVRSIERTAAKHGYDVLLYETADDERGESKVKEFVSARKVDGVIHLSARAQLDVFQSVYEDVPLVLACEYIDHVDLPSVSIDNIAAAMDATRHLIELGHRDILFVNGPASIILCRDRMRGYRIALEQKGIPFRQELAWYGDFTMQSGYRAVGQALAKGIGFTAVFCANDAMAFGAMKALDERGLEVPGHVSVVGFDDIEFSSYSRPPLTTITQPFETLGVTAMEMWLKLSQGQPVTYPVKLPHKLTVRGSSGPARSAP